jgi:Methyltransferase domain
MGGGRPPLETLQATLHDKRDDSILIYADAVKEGLARANERAPFDPEPAAPRRGAPVPQAPASDGSDGSVRYPEWGVSAVRCIETAVEAGRRVLPRKAEKSGWSSRILVFPCGRGHVVRALRGAFPDAEITACDLDRQAVDFCAEAFGAVPLYADEDPDRIEIDSTFDLIWAGSLFTHLDSGRWLPFIELLEGRLRPWGILLFATNGSYRAAGLGSTELEVEGADEMRTEYARTGFSHRGGQALSHHHDPDGQGLSGWGISISSLAWVCKRLEERPALRLIACAEQAWNRHLDVLACTRVAPWVLISELARANPAITEDELVALSGYDAATIRRHLAAQAERGAPSAA